MTARVKHTPGPWKACLSVKGDFLGIYPDTPRMEFPVAKMSDYMKPEFNEANATLIAAAPDMLAALDAALDCSLSADEQVARIRAAIAKARF